MHNIVCVVYPYFAHVAESVSALCIDKLSIIIFFEMISASLSTVLTLGIVRFTDD